MTPAERAKYARTKQSTKGSAAFSGAIGAAVGAVVAGPIGAAAGGAVGAYSGYRSAKKHNLTADALTSGKSGPNHGNPAHAHAVMRKAIANRHK